MNSDVDYIQEALQVNFINNSSEGNHSWSFGDGSQSNEISPIHEYGSEGIYQVTHTVENICGSDQSLLEVNLYTMPEALFTIESGTGCAPFEVSPVNVSSENSTQFTWISDGAEILGEAENPMLSYIEPGLYDVTLIASNPAGNDTMTIRNAIKVIDVPESKVIQAG